MSDSENDAHSSRAPPLTGEEKAFLFELINNHKTIIENKKSDSVWKEKKNKTWQTISLEFNLQPNFFKRTENQLKKSWENFKKKAKSEATIHAKELKKTGGGSAPDEISSISKQVMSIVPFQISPRPLINEFDSDALDSDRKLLAANSISSYSPYSSTGACDNVDEDLSYTPQAKKTKTDGTDARKKKLPYAQEQLLTFEEEQHKKKMELLQLKIKYRTRKIKIMEEEHSYKMGILLNKITVVEVKNVEDN